MTLEHRDLVAALRGVPGVSDVEVQPDGAGGPGLLRLDLEPGVDEAAVAGSVGRILRDRFGLGVDADHVQVIEEAISPRAAAAAAPPSTPSHATSPTRSATPSATGLVPDSEVVPGQRHARPSISRMHLVSSGLDVNAAVTLSSGARSAVGEARGAASQSGVHRAVATATLRAVEELVDGVVRFELDHLEVTPVGVERTVLVSLTMLSAKGTERLTGAAAVREDVRQAVIRATLDALNRRLEILLTDG
ncbi:MAG: hypothetical protein H7233_08905 [Pseudorhodobacter sp.]|nr:hypothetical protein [Frankiaceae bacterium]